ncbi:MAG: CotH kinase family protein, partial [Draconibacterium sp.]|nr:CotH kinase family protein [Draconibacterium sp.]
LKKDCALTNMRTSSHQNPSTRYFLAEWPSHKIFKHENVLTTRYGFIPVKINDQSLGIYAWEEHFEKQLIESNNRREGPIIRFDESLFWQRVLETKVTGKEWNIDYFGAAKIIPFKANKTVSDTALYKQFTEAQNLLFQYKNRVKPVSEIFDINKLAKYYALVDITQAYHGFAWHNQRFYYNPVTCLLEPIAFDGYIENGVFKRIDEQVNGLLNADNIYNYSREELLLFQAFADSVFNKKYIHYLQEYSTPEFVDEIISEYQQNADSLSALIKDEFPYYQFNFSLLKKQTEFVRNNINKIESNILELRTAINAVQQKDFGREYTTDVNKNLIPFQVQAFFDKSKQQLEILNFSNTTIKVLGVFMANQLPVSFDSKFEIKPYKGTNPQRISVEQTGSPLKVLFSVNNEMFETEVSNWPAPGNLSRRQKMLENLHISDLPVIDNTVYFDGKYSFHKDVVIPATMNVVFKPGTEIDLVNGAGFFSFAPVEMIGTEIDSIKITSSDKSANGFNIIQPKGLSQLKFVRFSGISNLRKGGWQTPAAISFYEADVKMKNCTFETNFNCDDALNIVRSDFSVANCRFENTFADAFDSDFCTGKVSNCIFENIGNDAIDFSGSNVEIANCRMINISDKAISGGENSTLFVSECEINKANIGVAAKDLSKVELNKIKMLNTVYGLVAFQKKPEYGPAKIIIDNLKIGENVISHHIELNSVLIVNGKTINGNEKKLAIKLYQ